MKRTAIGSLALCAVSCLASTTYYVSPVGDHVPPFSDWSIAATNIQNAIDAAADGDTVLVTNGTYYLASEIVVDKEVLIESVYGPDVTIVDGNDSVRCFNLGNNACVVSGLTIRNGYVTESNGSYPNDEGGGIYCADLSPVITNCVIRANTVAYYGKGGGVSGGSIYDSIIVSNSATHGQGGGGGLYMSVANSCVITHNFATGADGLGAGMWGGAGQQLPCHLQQRQRPWCRVVHGRGQ